jgi:cytochrome c553
VIALLALLAGAGAPAAAPAPPPRAEACASCHGPDGNSSDPDVPSLAGQQPAYLSLQLVQYREQRRQDDRMSPFAKDLTDADIEALAAWYAAQRPTGGRRALVAARVTAGKKVAEANHCGSCHMPDLSGQRHVPRLAGQHYEYLLVQMRAFKAQTRAELDGSMTMAAQPLSTREIEDVVAWIASLQAIPGGATGSAGRAPGR